MPITVSLCNIDMKIPAYVNLFVARTQACSASVPCYWAGRPPGTEKEHLSCAGRTLGRLSLLVLDVSWKLPSDQVLSETLVGCVDSPVFFTQHMEFHLRCFLNGNNALNREYVSVYLITQSRMDSTPSAVRDIELSVVPRNGERHHRRSFRKLIPFDDGWGFDRFIRRQTLLNDFLGLDSGLTIRCRVSDPTSSSGGSEVGSQMRSLLVSKAFHDVVFRVGNCKFYAHRAVVAARCPKLAEFFKDNPVQNRVQSVHLDGAHPDVFQDLLCFMYSGQVNRTNLSVIELHHILTGAQLLNMTTLRTLCEDGILIEPSVENWPPLLLFGHKNSLQGLKEKVIKFIRMHQDLICHTDAWRDLSVSHPKLIVEICTPRRI